MLAERNPTQVKPSAEANLSLTEAVAVLEATTSAHKAHASAEAPPASGKASPKAHDKARLSELMTSSRNDHQPEVEMSAAEATPVQGSPEPSAAPTAVQPRTTRSRSKRMSTDASPSISIASKQSTQTEPEGKPSLTKPPSGRGRRRSLTPAHPPAAAANSPAPAAASPAPAEASAAGTGTTVKAASASNKRQCTPDTGTTVKAMSAGKKRQRTPDTATKRPVPSRRSSRLSAAASDKASPGEGHHEEEDGVSRPAEAGLTTVDVAPADEPQEDGGVQLGSAATAADEEEQAPAEAAAEVHDKASDRTASADPSALTLTDAAAAAAAADASDAAEATAKTVSQGGADPAEPAIPQQPEVPAPDRVRISAEMVEQISEQPAPADGQVDQVTSGAQAAAASTTAASQQDLLASASLERAATESQDASVAQASPAADFSESAQAAGPATDAPAETPTCAAESTPLITDAQPITNVERPAIEKAQVPRSAADGATAGTDASSAAQVAHTGLAPATRPVDTAPQRTSVTDSSSFADATEQERCGPRASMSVAAPGAAEKPLLLRDSSIADGTEINGAVAAAESEAAEAAAQAEAAGSAAQVSAAESAAQAEAAESAAAALAKPPTGLPDASTASQPQSPESPASASQATVAPPAAAAAAAVRAPAALLRTLPTPKPPQTSGSTRIGLPNRLSSLSKSLLGPAQHQGGSTHIRPILSKGLAPGLKADRGAKALHSSQPEGSTGTVCCLGHPVPDMTDYDNKTSHCIFILHVTRSAMSLALRTSTSYAAQL